MIKDKKQLLVVDDSVIDREVLKCILCEDFDVMEAENGYSALEIIMKQKGHMDAILLDISMPVLDGFSVLRFLRENNVDNIPVFLITAEATKDNVEKAAQYNVFDFISKPFDSEEILKRLKSKLGVIAKHNLSEIDVAEINKYISDLDALYKKYFTIFGEDHTHYVRMTNLMKILLHRYAIVMQGINLDESRIDIISKAAYFCDIGNILVQNNVKFKSAKQDEVGSDHAILGADLVRLNYSKQCEYFVQICADMCVHHHERYDGSGFPHKISGSNISVYTQMCRLVDEFDNLFFKYREHNELQFDHVIKEITQDVGAVRKELISLLIDCKISIMMYYNNLK